MWPAPGLDATSEQIAFLSVVSPTVAAESVIAADTASAVLDSSDVVDLVIKFDSACSRNMSGNPQRLQHTDQLAVTDVRVRGFNNSISSVDRVGLNADNKTEYYIKSMPRDLALLCAHEYAKDGAAILLPDGGKVIKLSADERQALQHFIAQFPTIKTLKVRNRTYEIDQSTDLSDQLLLSNTSTEEAHNSTATKYFNTKVHVSNTDERILATLLTGLSFEDIYRMTKNSSVDGLSRDITITSLNSFANNYGRTPDTIQLALPNLAGNKKGYMAPPVVLSAVGDRVECDFFECEFNEIILDPTTSKKITRKLPSHGGAIAGFVAVDVYSGYVHGQLTSSMKESVNHVKNVVEQFELDGHKIKLLAADQGIISRSLFTVTTPAVKRYLQSKQIQPETAEPYNHNNGTPNVERTVRTIQELIRFALLYVLRNPNFKLFGFTQVQVLKLWGELFNWAIVIINLKTSRSSNITKFEKYRGTRPDLRRIRLLPIFASLCAFRENPHHDLQSRRSHWQRGLYVGPSLDSPGLYRIAVVTNGAVQIITTSNIKAVSDGGDIDSSIVADRHVSTLLQTFDNSSPQPESGGIISLQSPKLSADNNLQLLTSITVTTHDTTSSPTVHTIVPLGGTEEPGSPPQQRQTRTKRNATSMITADPRVTRSQTIKPTTSPASEAYLTACLCQEQELVESFATQCLHDPSHNSDRATIHSINQLFTSLFHTKHIEECYLTDWITHSDETYYYSFTDQAYCEILPFDPVIDYSDTMEDGYRAVTDNVPRTFTDALHHPEWGTAARKEHRTIFVDTKAVIPIDKAVALQHIKEGAEVLRLMPVYEEKIKENQFVRKVRLVADGRFHKKFGHIYSPTPSREELFILLHVFAVYGWNWYWLDENRAFLSADKQDPFTTLVRVSGDPNYYLVKKALYGMKTASRDYQDEVARRMTKLGFIRLTISSCIYKYFDSTTNDIVYVYDYVDDFVFGGSSDVLVRSLMDGFREMASTSPPEMNYSPLIGMELSRDTDRHIICITMTKRIIDLANSHPHTMQKERKVPMPPSGFLVSDHQFDILQPAQQRFLTNKEITTYMSIVGSLIWIQGVRYDIIFTVLYLSWFAQKPRQHHLNMAYYCVGYLYCTKDIPLVLGGTQPIQITGYTDASLGTGPKARSITSQLTKLGADAGAITAKATASQSVTLSSFEAELDGTTNLLKTTTRIDNKLNELGIHHIVPTQLYSDNDAMIKFIKGEGVAKGVRHMEMRMWYTREHYLTGNYLLDHMAGINIPTDKMTKLGSVNEHITFRDNVLGLCLLSPEHRAKLNLPLPQH